MMNKKGLLFVLVLSTLLHTAELHAESVRHQLAQRGARIETLKQHGLVTEQPDGLLATVSRDPEIIDLISKENSDRRARYNSIIEEQCRKEWPDNYRKQALCRQEKQKTK